MIARATAINKNKSGIQDFCYVVLDDYLIFHLQERSAQLCWYF